MNIFGLKWLNYKSGYNIFTIIINNNNNTNNNDNNNNNNN